MTKFQIIKMIEKVMKRINHIKWNTEERHNLYTLASDLARYLEYYEA